MITVRLPLYFLYIYLVQAEKLIPLKITESRKGLVGLFILERQE